MGRSYHPVRAPEKRFCRLLKLSPTKLDGLANRRRTARSQRPREKIGWPETQFETRRNGWGRLNKVFVLRVCFVIHRAKGFGRLVGCGSFSE